MLAGKDDEQQQQLLQEDEAEDEHAVHLKRESSVLSQQSNASATTPQPTRNYLADFMIHILLPLLTQRQKTLINADNYEQFIADVFPDFTHFADMNVLDKIKVLKSIEMAHVEISDPDLVSLQNFESCQELVVWEDMLIKGFFFFFLLIYLSVEIRTVRHWLWGLGLLVFWWLPSV